MNKFVPTSMATALALCLLGTGVTAAHAQATTPRADGTAANKELAAARTDLARASRRVAELSRGTAHANAPDVRVERRLVRRPVLGVLLAPDERAGVRITGVTPDSGAARAGLKSGDRIVSVDDRQLLGSNGELRLKNLRRLLAALDEKSSTRIGYDRDGHAATVAVTPRVEQHMFVWNGGNDKPVKPGSRSAQGQGSVFAFDADDFDFDFDVEAMTAGIAPEIRREIVRIGPDGKCKGNGCRAPMLMSAFRWNGLNLASVDAQLGRYFGADHGVLVLSNGELKGLQAGDVIQRIDGKPVTDPREAMAALRGKPDGAKVAVDYLRDRKGGQTQVTVPKLMLLPFPPEPPAAPSPPAPPASPKAPPPPPPSPSAALVPGPASLTRLAMARPPAPPAAPVPPAPPAMID